MINDKQIDFRLTSYMSSSLKGFSSSVGTSSPSPEPTSAPDKRPSRPQKYSEAASVD